jgi:DNA-binding IscR family transcriptional regulator
MQLTRSTDYALRAMIHLAGLGGGARAGVADIAAAGRLLAIG